MKANAPEKLYLRTTGKLGDGISTGRLRDTDIEYTSTDAFINKAKKWFEQQPETYDANGVRVYGDEDFEDFKKYMEGEEV